MNRGLLILLVLLLSINPASGRQIIDETINIPAHAYWWFDKNLDANATVSVTAKVIKGEKITFHILDEENFEIREEGSVYPKPYYISPNKLEISESLIINHTGKYYFYFSGTNLDTSEEITVKVGITVTYPPFYISTDTRRILVFGAALILIIYLVRKRTRGVKNS